MSLLTFINNSNKKYVKMSEDNIQAYGGVFERLFAHSYHYLKFKIVAKNVKEAEEKDDDLYYYFGYNDDDDFIDFLSCLGNFNKIPLNLEHMLSSQDQYKRHNVIINRDDYRYEANLPEKIKDRYSGYHTIAHDYIKNFDVNALLHNLQVRGLMKSTWNRIIQKSYTNAPAFPFAIDGNKLRYEDTDMNIKHEYDINSSISEYNSQTNTLEPNEILDIIISDYQKKDDEIKVELDDDFGYQYLKKQNEKYSQATGKPYQEPSEQRMAIVKNKTILKNLRDNSFMGNQFISSNGKLYKWEDVEAYDDSGRRTKGIRNRFTQVTLSFWLDKSFNTDCGDVLEKILIKNNKYIDIDLSYEDPGIDLNTFNGFDNAVDIVRNLINTNKITFEGSTRKLLTEARKHMKAYLTNYNSVDGDTEWKDITLEGFNTLKVIEILDFYIIITMLYYMVKGFSPGFRGNKGSIFLDTLNGKFEFKFAFNVYLIAKQSSIYFYGRSYLSRIEHIMLQCNIQPKLFTSRKDLFARFDNHSHLTHHMAEHHLEDPNLNPLFISTLKIALYEEKVLRIGRHTDTNMILTDFIKNKAKRLKRDLKNVHGISIKL
jgi:hypothetical protein